MPAKQRVKSFLIFLGAQKSGSTWLWNYFRDHPQCAAPPLKELHFFNRNVARMIRLLEEAELELSEAENPDECAFLQDKQLFILRAIDVFNQTDCTEEDFARLVYSVATNETRLVAEFTPANGVLSVQRLKSLAGLSVAPKFALILRDPVDRLWSQIRMQAYSSHRDPAKIQGNASLLLERFLECKTSLKPIRYDYELMLERAQKTIPKNRLFVEFFETFMNQDGIRRFCVFLGIDYIAAKLDEPRLVGQSVDLAPGDRSRLRDALMPQYRAVEKVLGKLPERWCETLDL